MSDEQSFVSFQLKAPKTWKPRKVQSEVNKAVAELREAGLTVSSVDIAAGSVNITAGAQTVLGPVKDVMADMAVRNWDVQLTTAAAITNLFWFKRANPALTLWVDPGDAPSELVAEIFQALDACHRAAGGNGLRFQMDGDEVVIADSELV